MVRAGKVDRADITEVLGQTAKAPQVATIVVLVQRAKALQADITAAHAPTDKVGKVDRADITVVLGQTAKAPQVATIVVLVQRAKALQADITAAHAPTDKVAKAAKAVLLQEVAALLAVQEVQHLHLLRVRRSV
jgi:hypothetical protein